MKIAIGIFAKTPELSPVKTRLAQTIGEEKANGFYALSVAAVDRNLKDLRDCFNNPENPYGNEVDLTCHWALAEAEGVGNAFWKGKSCLWTGEGSLGERLHQVSQRLFEFSDYVFVMGTDSPQVGTEILKRAMEHVWRNRKKAIIGPCSDGGFYLFGMPVPLDKALWTSVIYSQESTCQQLMTQLTEKGFEIELLPVYGDVDVEGDLVRLKKELLEGQEALNNEQAKLLNWLQLKGI